MTSPRAFQSSRDDLNCKDVKPRRLGLTLSNDDKFFEYLDNTSSFNVHSGFFLRQNQSWSSYTVTDRSRFLTSQMSPPHVPCAYRHFDDNSIWFQGWRQRGATKEATWSFIALNPINDFWTFYVQTSIQFSSKQNANY